MPRSLPLALEPPTDVEQVCLHAHGARFVEAGLDDARRFSQRTEIAALIPGAPGRPRDGRDHRDFGVLAHRCPDFRDQRGDDAAAEVEITAQVAVGCEVGPPESFGHVRRVVDVAVEIAADFGRCLGFEPPRVDAGLLRAGEAVLAKTEPQHVLQPRVGLHQREFVVVAMRIGREAGRLHRNAANGVALGHVFREADGVGARLGRRGAEVVEIRVAERIAHHVVGMRHAEAGIV